MDVAHQVLGDSVAQDGWTVRLNLPHRFVVKITLCACVRVCVHHPELLPERMQYKCDKYLPIRSYFTCSNGNKCLVNVYS